LEWIKVTARHAEYDFVGAPAEVFRAWITAMIFTAVLEKIPTEKQLEMRLGKENYHALVKHLKENNAPLEKVLKKVMEDVHFVNQKRKHNRNYMSEYRSNTLRKPLRETHVNGNIREDKIREDKTSSLKDLSSKNPEIKASLEKMGVKL
jgi:hypothetical protein